MLTDTSAEAERVHLRLMREAGQLRRSTLASSLTSTCMRRGRAAVQRTRPHLSPFEQDLFFLSILHGPELAGRVRRHLSTEAAA